MCVAAPYLWPNRTWAQALRRSRADSGGELAFSPIWQAIGEATRTRLTGDQNAPSWAVGTPAKSPATAETLTRVDLAPPATSADIEDLSFWLANQFVSHAFEVFYDHFRALCRTRSDVNIESLVLSFTSKAINATTLKALFKDENNNLTETVETIDASKTDTHRDQLLQAEKSRMQKAWSMQQEAKLQTMVTHLNLLFKSDKFEACNVNHLYQVTASSAQRLLPSRHSSNLSVHPCIHPLILRTPSPTPSPTPPGETASDHTRQQRAAACKSASRLQHRP